MYIYIYIYIYISTNDICVCTVYIYYVYINTHTCMYIFKKTVTYIHYIAKSIGTPPSNEQV